MTSGPTMLRGRCQHLALELDHFGHAFEHDAGAGERGVAMSCERTTETRAIDGVGVGVVSRPNRARLASVFPTSPSASASSVANCSAVRALTSIMVTAWPA